MTWGRKTGGRQKGTKNKKTRKLEAATAKDGITPLDYLLSVMRDGEAQRHERTDAAKAAAPYLHPRLQSTVLSGIGKDGAIKLVYDKDDLAL
jgi:hypothetical protein